MIVLIALPTIFIYLVVFGGYAFYLYHESRAAVERDTTRLAASYASRFDGYLREAQRIADTTARAMEAVHTVTDNEIYDLLERNVEQTELVYGAAMAFEPGKRRPVGELFAPYVWRGESGLQRLNIDRSVYDWYQDPRFTWFSRPKALGKGVWSDPYFDEGAGNVLMSTYSAPFDLDDSFGGVNTVDIDLPQLRQTVGRDLRENLDFVILTADGRFVYDPDARRIMSQTILGFAKEQGNPQLESLAPLMLSGRAGMGEVDRWDTPQRQMVFYAPIPSADWVFVCRVPTSVVLVDVRRQTVWSAAALAIALPLTICSIFIVSRRIARPIMQLRNKVMQVASGALDTRIPEGGQAEELQHLARSFNGMTAELGAHIERLATETAARQRIEHDLAIARDIQRSLLPAKSPDLPAYEIVGWSQPAEQTGGDYYDWQTIAGGPTLITLADVSGHGVGPALVTAVCRAYARASFSTVREFSTVIEELNDLLAADLTSGRFVTLVAVLLDPQSSRASMISAGHGPIFHYIAAERRLVDLESTNLPLGVMPDLSYSPAVECQLGVGFSSGPMPTTGCSVSTVSGRPSANWPISRAIRSSAACMNA
jgi:sigma-B regulation protein RsbU (phosphoserine phosphatase)